LFGPVHIFVSAKKLPPKLRDGLEVFEQADQHLRQRCNTSYMLPNYGPAEIMTNVGEAQCHVNSQSDLSQLSDLHPAFHIGQFLAASTIAASSALRRANHPENPIPLNISALSRWCVL
jgi:hypothetical protein